MSDTRRRGTVTTEEGWKYNRYWMKHDPSWYRRGLNQSFRAREKNYFNRFLETLIPVKNRGYYW